jgi:hypothetical protein
MFPCFRDIGPPYIATLTLPRFTVRLPIWLFSTLMVPNSPVATQESSPHQENQPHIDPFPSSPVTSSSLSSSSPGEIIDPSNQEAKKKKKRKNNKKKNKQGSNQPTTFMSVDNVENPTNICCNPKFPCRICKGEHLFNYFPIIPKVLEV